MSFVNMKKLEAAVEHRIMILINAKSARGMPVDAIQRYFQVGGLQSAILREDIPGWLDLSEVKRKNRLNKIIRRLVKDGRARLTNEDGTSKELDKPYVGGIWAADRLIPLNVLDKIVYALELSDVEDQKTL